MKNITLTSNEVLTLMAEGMTLAHCQSLAGKLRNADLPHPAVYPSVAAYEKTRKDNEDLSKECARHYEDLEKAKQTESTLRDENRELTERTNRLESKLRDLENDARQDDESLKYFRKWIEELRVATGYDEGVTAATIFSNSIELVRQHNELCKRAFDLESKLTKANDVIATVKSVYDNKDARTSSEVLVHVRRVVEVYYRGN